MTDACESFRELAPELALGIADGDERAAALDHLSGCASCRRVLDSLTDATDAVIATAPPVDPPEGFAERADAAFATVAATNTTAPEAGPSGGADDHPGHEDVHRPTPQPLLVGAGASTGGPGRRSPWLVAATILAVLGVLVGGALAWHGSRGDQLLDATLQRGTLRLPDGRAVGEVHVEPGPSSATAGHDADTDAEQTATGTGTGTEDDDEEEGGDGDRLVISIDRGAPIGRYQVRCDYEAGGPYAAGELEVGPDGVRRWSAAVDVPTYDLRRVRLVSTTGTENLEAEIPA